MGTASASYDSPDPHLLSNGPALSLASPGTRDDGDRRKREPFRLLFRGPSLPILPQRIYLLEHAALGRLELFIVPIGPGQYEAIFT